MKATEKELEEIIEKLVANLEGFTQVPKIVDKATVPKAGIDSNPDQVVFEASVSYSRILRAQKLISEAKSLLRKE